MQLQLKLQLKDSKALLIQDIYLTFVLQKQVQLPLNLQLVYLCLGRVKRIDCGVQIVFCKKKQLENFDD